MGSRQEEESSHMLSRRGANEKERRKNWNCLYFERSELNFLASFQAVPNGEGCGPVPCDSR